MHLMCVTGVNVCCLSFLIPYLFSDVAFGGEAGNMLTSDPLQVQVRPTPVAAVHARLAVSEAAAGVVGALQVL